MTHRCLTCKTCGRGCSLCRRCQCYTWVKKTCAACEQDAYFSSPERTAEDMEASQPPVLYHTCQKRKGTDR